MALKAIFCVIVLALFGAIVWPYTGAKLYQQRFHREPAKAKPFVFDNGTVREFAAPAASGAAIIKSNLVNALRKCQRGVEIIYTDNVCQKGFREQPIKNGSVTVIDGNPEAGSVVGAPQPSARPVLRELLDEPGHGSLRGKQMNRALGQ